MLAAKWRYPGVLRLPATNTLASVQCPLVAIHLKYRQKTTLSCCFPASTSFDCCNWQSQTSLQACFLIPDKLDAVSVAAKAREKPRRWHNLFQRFGYPARRKTGLCICRLYPLAVLYLTRPVQLP